MKWTKTIITPHFDAVAEEDDHIDVRTYTPAGGNGKTLCIDVNGVTVVRIGNIQNAIALVEE